MFGGRGSGEEGDHLGSCNAVDAWGGGSGPGRRWNLG